MPELYLPNKEYQAFVKWAQERLNWNWMQSPSWHPNRAGIREDSLYLEWVDAGSPGYEEKPGALTEEELWDEYRDNGFIAQSISLEQPTVALGEGFVWSLLEFDPSTGAKLSPDKIGLYITPKEEEPVTMGAPEITSIGGYDYEVMVDPETGEKTYALIGKTVEVEPEEEMTEFEREQLALWERQAEEERRRGKREEAQWYTQFFETQRQEMYRRGEEERLAGERGRERMMGERQSIMQLALEREGILAELRAHPRNWIEAEMYRMGTQPYGMSQISPGWGATPGKTPAPARPMGGR